MAFGGCNSGQEALTTAIHLPWLIEPALVGMVFVLLILEMGTSGLPGYSIECETIVGKFTDTCTGNTGAEAKNVATAVEVEFSEISEEITPAITCTGGGAMQGLFFGLGIATNTEGGILSVS